MKQSRVTPISDGPGNISTSSGGAAVQNSDLLWVDEVAALLPEELRLGWYRNVKPWISTLPPEDEVAHLAYSMGYLALLIRNAPAMVAAERGKLAPVLQQLSKEVNDSLSSTAAYHHRLEERLGRLPTEVASGINTAEFVARITQEVRNLFSRSGLPEAAEMLNGEGERLGKLASEQVEALRRLRCSIDDSKRNANDALEAVAAASRRAKDSIELWNREMRSVQWLHHGLALFIGLLLGCLSFWWAFGPRVAPGLQNGSSAHSQPSAQSSEKVNTHEPK